MSLRIELIRHDPSIGGLHRAAELIAVALRAAGYEVDETELPQHGHAPTSCASPQYALRVACVNADQFHRVAVVEGVPLVGWWSWELDTFRPSFAQAAAGTTAVWTLSTHAALGLSTVLDVPVRVLPLPVVEPPLRVASVPGRLRVLVVADHASGPARKNAVGAVRAFCRAFSPDAGASLTIKTSSGDAHPGAARRLAQLVAGRSDVEIIDRRLPRHELMELFANTDVVLSLHRAEGFGLPLAEGMSAGSVVVGTAYGGPSDYMNRTNSVLIPCRLVRIGLGHWPYPATARWAEPDEAAAAQALVRLREDDLERAALGARAASDMQNHHSVAARLPLLRQLVSEAVALGPAGGERVTTRPPKPPARWVAGALHRLDVGTHGLWVVPVGLFDRWKARPLRR